MQKSDMQKEQCTKKVQDVARSLGVVIVQSVEYQVFHDTEQRFQNDAGARELLGQYQEAQRTMQLMKQLGTINTEDAKRLEDLQNNVEANPTLAGYFEAQEKLTELLKELNEFISTQLNLDFAELTKPKRGCCG